MPLPPTQDDEGISESSKNLLAQGHQETSHGNKAESATFKSKVGSSKSRVPPAWSKESQAYTVASLESDVPESTAQPYVEAQHQESGEVMKPHRLKSYYRGSISLRSVPNANGYSSPEVIYHSSSGPPSTVPSSRQTSNSSLRHVNGPTSAAGGVRIPSPVLDVGEMASATSPSSHLVSNEAVRDTIEHYAEVYVDPGAPPYHDSGSFRVGDSSSSSLAGSPVIPWSPISPRSRRSPTLAQYFESSPWLARPTRRGISGSPVSSSEAAGSYAPVSPRLPPSPILAQLSAPSPWLSRPPRRGMNNSPTSMVLQLTENNANKKTSPQQPFTRAGRRCVTPQTKTRSLEAQSSNDGDVPSEGALTPLSPKVQIHRGFGRRRSMRKARTPEQVQLGAAELDDKENKKRCASYYDQDILGKLGASPGKKR